MGTILHSYSSVVYISYLHTQPIEESTVVSPTRLRHIIANIKKALVPKKHINPTTKVLVKYYKYLDIFSQKEANKLAEYRPYNHKIILKEKKTARI